MARTTTTSRLAAFIHLSPLNLHRAHLPATTPATFIQQAAYSTRKHVPDSVKNNAKNNNSIGNNLPTRVGTHASQHTPSRQHGKGEPSALNRRAHYSPAKSKRTTTLRRPPPPPPKEYRQEELVADQSINEPLPESQIRMTSQEPSRPAPATPLPRVHESWDHATRELSYKPGYRNAEKHADRSLRAGVMKASTSQQTARRNNANSSGKHELGRSKSTSSVVENVYPTNFWTVPDTERIESADKEGVQRLFSQRAGTRTVQTDAFSLKSARMTFVEPPVPNVPKFVELAMEEYSQAMAVYRQNQLELDGILESSTDTTISPDSTASSAPLSPILRTTVAATVAPLPLPKPSPFIRQYSLRNLRRYPATVDAPHPPYRVVYVISKKIVSKLAVHRNLCRKKLSAAVEAVFREHARPGYEFMFFAKHQCVTTSQEDLEEMLIKTLADPNLYADTASRGRYSTSAKSIGSTTTTMTSQLPAPIVSVTQGSGIAEKSTVKIRWKNNQPPLKWNWWKHALPHPLGRTRQPNEYLNMHCPKPPKEESVGNIAEQKDAVSAKAKE